MILTKISPGLKRIIIADDPEVCGKTLGVAIAIYNSYELAKVALNSLQGAPILANKLAIAWKDPFFDVIAELCSETRTIFIKNISTQTTVP